MVTDVILASDNGLNVLGFTGIFSKSSSDSKPSMILKQQENIINNYGCFSLESITQML